MKLDPPRVTALVLAGIVVAVLGLGACGAGGWVLLGPVNSSGCGTNTPPGITAADLVGPYITADGAGLRLDAAGTLDATALFDEDSGDLSGAGRYWFAGDPDRCNLYRFNRPDRPTWPLVIPASQSRRCSAAC